MPVALRDKLEGKRAFNSYDLGEVKRGDGKGVHSQDGLPSRVPHT